MSNGLAKNWDVVQGELRHWWFVMQREQWPRLKRGSFHPHDRNNYLHLGVNLITETYRALPRTLTYATLLGLVAVVVF